MMTDILLASPVRTPIGKLGGKLSRLSAAELGAIAAGEAVQRAGCAPEQVDQTIFGNARQAGNGPNIARQIASRAGLPYERPAYTVNQACGSGLQAILSAARAIRLGEAGVVLAGGTESMSNTPYLLTGARQGYVMGHGEVVDGMYRDGFFDPLCSLLMGETAENLAEQYGISREEQDAYALASQQRCERARRQGLFRPEIVPVTVTDKLKQPESITEDEHPRDGLTLEILSRLPPVFRSHGTVHAGNSAGVTDGAAALLVLSESRAAVLGVTPLARIVDQAVCGVDPALMGIGPVPAVKQLLQRTGLSLEEIDLVELNEAFAAQVIACDRDLGFPPACLNVNGGAIALGHPIGCSGARIVVTLLHEMQRQGARRGLATLCISGGMGMAMLVERV